MKVFIMMFMFATSLFGQVEAVWDASPSSGVEKYRIYWGPQSRVYDDFREVFGLHVQLPLVLFEREIVYYFAVTAIDFSGKESDFSEETFLFIVTSIDENETLKLGFYPNPFKDKLTLMGYERGELFNIRGQLIGEVELLDLSRLASGFYILRGWTSENIFEDFKVVKVN